jgi:uncharacterized protein with FMN-binding domain
MKGKHPLWYSVLAGSVLLILALGIVGGIWMGRVKANLEALKTLPIADIPLSAVPDGVYPGEYKSFPVEVTLKVRVKAHRIEGVDLIRHVNGKGGPAEGITNRVVQAQTLRVDSVSGATYSSRVILKAMENALSGVKAAAFIPGSTPAR